MRGSQATVTSEIMKITLTVPDSVFEQYEQQAGSKQGALAYMAKRLATYAEADPKERPLVLTSGYRQRLEDILESTIESPEAVCDLCERLVRLDISDASYEFSVDELERLAQQASFFGEPLPVFINRTLGEFAQHSLGLS